MDCSSRRISRELYQVESAKEINSNKKYVKVHLKNGDFYVLHSWYYDDAGQSISGRGTYLDYNRKVVKDMGTDSGRPNFIIPMNDVLLLETNDKGTNPGIAVLVITSLATGIFGLACLLNPKGCFGSCPTFYVENDNEQKLVGEGFSSSISRSLEATDVDLINYAQKEGMPFRLTVKNEAWETHMLNKINILAYPKLSGRRIIQEAGGQFYEVGSYKPPVKAEYQSESILEKIAAKDDSEWFSLANEKDLNTKEDIFLEFDNSDYQQGIIIEKRQSLMTTFLFYNLISMIGKANAFYISEMETSSPYLQNRVTKMYDLLGGIEASVLDKENRWRVIQTVREAGPIVTDTHLVKLPPIDASTIKVRLSMTQGLWRINTVNLVNLYGKVSPQRYMPSIVLHDQKISEGALQKLTSENYLVTFPGDEYVLEYPITYDSSFEYFIESKGYYLEWVREEWLKDEDLNAAKRVILFPSQYLKKMAPHFKMVEPMMEESFWSSKYTKN